MFDAPSYRERADMHEQLACSTGDPAARSMHRAMAAEFRRKSEETREIGETNARTAALY